MMCGANVCKHHAVFNGAMKFFVKDDVCREMRLCDFSRFPVAPLLIAVLSMFSFGHANAQSVYINMGKGWSYITGAQRAVNDSNRVYYIMGNPDGGESQSVKPLLNDGFTPQLGHRVNNFTEMEDYYLHDSEFTKAHLTASQVYESEKMVNGPSFFISKTEVTNSEYRKFVEFCINEWMKENHPEIVQKYKRDVPKIRASGSSLVGIGFCVFCRSGSPIIKFFVIPCQNLGRVILEKLGLEEN